MTCHKSGADRCGADSDRPCAADRGRCPACATGARAVSRREQIVDVPEPQILEEIVELVAGHVFQCPAGQRTSLPVLLDRQRSDYFDVLVSNITSIRTKVATVAHGADGGLHIFTEANADINEINRVNIELKACSQGGQLEPKQSFWGTPAVTSNNGGVGLMCDRRFHDQVKRMPATTAARKQWQDATRLELFRVAAPAHQRHATDKGIVWLYFMVVYGVVGNRLETDRLLREVDTWVKEIGHNYPLSVVGDFNIELLDSQVLMELAAGGCST